MLIIINIFHVNSPKHNYNYVTVICLFKKKIIVQILEISNCPIFRNFPKQKEILKLKTRKLKLHAYSVVKITWIQVQNSERRAEEAGKYGR